MWGAIWVTILAIARGPTPDTPQTPEDPVPSAPSAPVPAPDPVPAPAPAPEQPPAPLPSTRPGLAPRPLPPEGEPVTVDLQWTAPAGCPSGERVRQDIAALLAFRVEVDPTAPIRIDGRITTTDAGYRLDLVVADDQGEDRRTLSANACEPLGEAAALIVTTSAYPTRVAQTLDRPPPTPEAPPPLQVTAAPPPEPQPPRDPTPPKRRVRVALKATAGPGFGILPRVAGGLFGSVGVLIGRARVEARAGHWFERTTDDTPGAAVRLTTGSLRGCFAPSVGRVEFPLCGGLSLGAMRAEGTGTGVAAEEDRSLWVASELGVGIAWAPIRRLAVVAGADGIIPLRRPGFHLDLPSGREEVFRAPPVGVMVWAGLEVRLR